MGTFGPNGGGTFASDNTLGVVSITNPGNALASDNSYATSVLLLSQISNYLKVTNFNFSIPTDAIIVGVTVSIERSSNTLNGTHDDSVRLVVGGAISGSDKASATQWPTSDAVASYGSSSDLWGLTPTPTDINASNFGVAVAAIADLASTAQIDYVSMTVDYIGSNKPGNALRQVKAGNGMSRSDLN